MVGTRARWQRSMPPRPRPLFCRPSSVFDLWSLCAFSQKAKDSFPRCTCIFKRLLLHPKRSASPRVLPQKGIVTSRVRQDRLGCMSVQLRAVRGAKSMKSVKSMKAVVQCPHLLDCTLALSGVHTPTTTSYWRRPSQQAETEPRPIVVYLSEKDSVRGSGCRNHWMPALRTDYQKSNHTVGGSV